MEDDEKVREGLRVCMKSGTLTCGDCPYFNDMTCVNSLANDASDLIDCLDERIAIMRESMEALEKRNEPMLAVDIVDNSIDCVKVGICPACEETIANIIKRPTKYCKYCGQAVKWE